MQRTAPEMVLVDFGSHGPWALQEEFQMDVDTMAFTVLNLTFTLAGMVTRLNCICPRYMSYQWEMEAVGRDFFSVLLYPDKFVYLHSHPHHLRRLLLHLERSKASGCLVFHYLPSKRAFSHSGQEGGLDGWCRCWNSSLSSSPTRR